MGEISWSLIKDKLTKPNPRSNQTASYVFGLYQTTIVIWLSPNKALLFFFWFKNQALLFKNKNKQKIRRLFSIVFFVEQWSLNNIDI